MAEESKTDAHSALLLDDVLAHYIAGEEAGSAPDRQLLLNQHPQFADDLREFFANRDQMQRLALPLRGDAEVKGGSQPLGKVRYFGDYELLEEVAAGGMGIIFRARQRSLNRIVAVKVILKGTLAREEDVKRFRAEAEAAAGLQHPAIVAIHEVGLHEGQHYFSMDYVDGNSLAELPREQPLSAHQAAEYIRDAAEAVHHAHQQGTLHRDLKPSNILIDRQGRVRITDFGLAKRIEGNSDLTLTGQILGTPSYMPPEQACGKRSLVAAASDIYSLGAVLYELLTGRPPFRGESPAETLRQVETLEPIAPRLLNPAAPRDLETICLKCLEKEPHKRYGTAQLLADDLGRYLCGEPIVSRPTTRIARLWRWCRRKPLVSGLTALTLAMFLVAVATLVASNAWVRSALKDRTRALGERTAAFGRLTDEQLKTREALAAKIKALEDLEKSSAELKQTLDRQQQESYFNSILLAWRECQAGHFENAEKQLTACRADLRSWEWHYIARLCRTTVPLAVLKNVSTFGGAQIGLEPPGIRLSGDGTHVALIDGDRSVLVLDATTGKEVTRLTGAESPISAIAITQDARRVAAVGLGRLTIWKTRSGSIDVRRSDLPRGNWVEFSNDAARLIVSERSYRVTTRDESLRRWGLQIATILDAESGRSLASRDYGTAYSADGRRFAALRNQKGSVLQIDDGLSTPLGEHAAPIAGGAFSPSGGVIATFDTSANLIACNAETGEQLYAWSLRPEGIERIQFSPDGEKLAVLTFLSTIRVFDITTGRLLATFRESPVERLTLPQAQPTATFGPLNLHQHFAFSPDGKQLASASGATKLTVWDLASGQETTLRTRDPMCFLAFQRNDRNVLYATQAYPGSSVSLFQWNTAGRDESRLIYRQGFFYHTVAVNSAGTRIASVVNPTLAPIASVVSVSQGGTSTIKIWNAHTRAEELVLPYDRGGHLFEVAFSPNDELLAMAGDSGVAIMDINSKKLRANVPQGLGRCTRVGFCNGGEQFLVGHAGGTSLYELKTGKEIIKFKSPGWCTCAALTSDESKIATAGLNGAVFIWDFATGDKLFDLSLGEHQPHVFCVAFSPDFGRLAAVDTGGRIHIWDTRSGERLLEVAAHKGRAYCITFSRDGKRLLSLGDEGVLRVWESTSGREVLTLNGHADRVYHATLTPDGYRIVSTSADGTIRIWDATPLPESSER